MSIQCVRYLVRRLAGFVSAGFLLLVLITGCQNESESVSGLRASLIPDRTSYQIGQPISVALVLENTSSTPLLLQTRMVVNIQQLCPSASCDVYFVVSDPQGKELEYRWLARVRLIEQTDFVNISPGEQYQVQLDLAQYYAPFDKAGKYTANVVYENQTDPGDGRVAWKGRLTSNDAAFTLEP